MTAITRVEASSPSTISQNNDTFCNRITNLFKKILEYKNAISAGIGALSAYSFGAIIGVGFGLAAYGVFSFLKYKSNANNAEAQSAQVNQSQENTKIKYPIVRKFPPKSEVDTIIWEKNDNGQMEFVSKNGQMNCFDDKEILKTHGSSVKKLTQKIYCVSDKKYYPMEIGFDHKGRSIIQQQAIRGCTAATAAMLIVDNGGNFNVSILQGRSLADNGRILQDIQDANLRGKKAIETRVENLKELSEQIKKNGPAIVSIDNNGSHSIVVDEISDNGVRLRDPYHGWSITVTKEAFEKRFSGNTIIQVVNRHSWFPFI